MLPKIPKPAELIKASYRLPGDLIEDLHLYAQAYNELNSDSVPTEEVLAALLRRWMAKDRDFQRWKKRRRLAGTSQSPRQPAAKAVANIATNERAPYASIEI